MLVPQLKIETRDSSSRRHFELSNWLGRLGIMSVMLGAAFFHEPRNGFRSSFHVQFF